MLRLATQLAEIRGIGPRFLKHLNKLQIKTVQDLLWHFPSRYEDFSQIYKIADLEPGQQATIQGVIQEIDIRQSWRRRMAIVEAIIHDDSGSIRAVWFNQSYIVNTLRKDRFVNLAGKVAITDHELYLSHPTYELLNRYETETKHTARLVPIYPETQGLTSRGIRFLVQPILKNIETLKEWIPELILNQNSLPEINEALTRVHFPDSIHKAESAKKRFAFEDIFLLQLLNIEQKLKLAKEKAPIIKTDIEWLKKILNVLPFLLTESQKKSLWEIIQDMQKPTPMNRLLQGDVGSGKTVVATLAALTAAIAGEQAVFMAPTEVLARQHFGTLKKTFERLPGSTSPVIGFIAAGGAKICYGKNLEAEIKKDKLKQKIENGEIKVIVGTHALIYGKTNNLPENNSIKFQKLGLVIIDEQHRFGVRERAALLKQTRLIPHLLSMSATPIPRTLMLTVFGDLDVSTITELPSGRKNIVTKAVDPENRDKAYEFIRVQIQDGRQAFVICPRIDPSEEITNDKFSSGGQNQDYKEIRKLELKSVKEEHKKLSEKIFPDLRVEILHGQLKSKEKEKIMRDFRNCEIDILVSTSVVEVGVDIPNATVMMIEGSDRFGLAQLYQFRGRVGRGKHQSYCLLFTDSNSRTTNERLKAIVEAKNGFELAEMDLKLRGPGQFLGTEQTGLPDLAMRGLQDLALIKTSREAALSIIQKDPELRKHPALQSKLKEFQRKIHLE